MNDIFIAVTKFMEFLLACFITWSNIYDGNFSIKILSSWSLSFMGGKAAWEVSLKQTSGRKEKRKALSLISSEASGAFDDWQTIGKKNKKNKRIKKDENEPNS